MEDDEEKIFFPVFLDISETSGMITILKVGRATFKVRRIHHILTLFRLTYLSNMNNQGGDGPHSLLGIFRKSQSVLTLKGPHMVEYDEIAYLLNYQFAGN